jgi:hypothetical protein
MIAYVVELETWDSTCTPKQTLDPSPAQYPTTIGYQDMAKHCWHRTKLGHW